MKKEELLKKYSEIIQMRKYSIETGKCYLYHLLKFFDFKTNVYPYNLSSQDINDYLVHLNSKNVSDSYFNQAINAIKFFFKYVLNRKIKDYMVVRPKRAKTQPIILDKTEIQKMFDVCTNLKHKTILSLLYSTGIRCSEVINLKIKDIDSKLMVIRIISGKGRKSRMVTLDTNVLEMLRKYYLEYKPIEYLFNGQNSLQYSKKSIEEVVKKLGVKCGINKRVYPHLFRHNYITDSLENGIDLRVIKESVGHSSIKTTEAYTHISPKMIANIKSPIQGINLDI